MSEIKINNIPVITENNGSVSLTTSTIDANGIILISGNQRALRFEKNDGTLDNIIYYNNGTSANKLSIGRDSSVLALRTDGIERMSIDSSGHVTMPYQPSFHVNKTDGNVNSENYYICNNVQHNIGGHYSTSTGRFTAPISGVYYLSFSKLAYANTLQNEIFLYKNGERFVDTRDDTQNSRYQTLGASVIAYLSAGDWVALYVRAGTIHGTSSTWSHFSGHLIK